MYLAPVLFCLCFSEFTLVFLLFAHPDPDLTGFHRVSLHPGINPFCSHPMVSHPLITSLTSCRVILLSAGAD